MAYAQAIPLDIVLSDIPQKKLEQLKKKGFKTLGDLLEFAPSRYEDRGEVITDFQQLKTLVGSKVSVVGSIVGVKVDYGKNFLSLRLNDENHFPVSVTWFHQNYLKDRFRNGEQIKIFGSLTYNDKYGYSIVSPDSYGAPDEANTPLVVYKKVAGMSSEYLTSCIQKGIDFGKAAGMTDPIPKSIREEIHLDDYITFVEKMHNPRNEYDIKAVKKRQCSEILLPFTVELTRRKMEFRATTDKRVPANLSQKALDAFQSSLPFALTEDQHRTLMEMKDIISAGRRLDALVQGDVGCGKTMVAAGAAAIVLAGGYQVAIMAPTTVLASQHYKEFKERFEQMGFSVAFLGGKESAKEKRETLKEIENGDANIVVGTHAIFADAVKFHNLGLTIADEEHRFGVEQREKLREKSSQGAHAISMTATPIPRTLALALYGDTVSVFNIHTMPAGRKPVITQAVSNEETVYAGMYRQIQQGYQCYLVCPLISASDSDLLKDVDSLEETEEKVRHFFEKYPEVKIASINGKMKADEIKNIITAFSNHQYDILLSTTIVEVGVNVPNATVMAIKNAERFGLAQLHQLRGRVGRGSIQSYCVLISPQKDKPRLQIMTQTTDGFEIAKHDLNLRGTGNLIGTTQSGVDEAVTNMVQHPRFYQQILSAVERQMKNNASKQSILKMCELLSNLEQ